MATSRARRVVQRREGSWSTRPDPGGLDRVGGNRVGALHDPDNPASGRMMAKCGMRHGGVLRAREHINLGIRDASMWAILVGDPRPERG